MTLSRRPFGGRRLYPQACNTQELRLDLQNHQPSVPNTKGFNIQITNTIIFKKTINLFTCMNLW